MEDLIKDDLRYRDHQLLRLKDEVLDLEDLDDTLSLTEFTLDDFRIELLKYLEANRSLLEGAPFGLYTCVPAHPEIKSIAPGVIFCLRQKTGGETKTSGETPDQINPLKPYFLVYVLADGNVRFGFTHPKQILTMYRELCTGKGTPNEALCNLFDRQTQNGINMSHYDSLLRKVIESIAVTFRKRVATTLLTNRNAVIPDKRDQADESTDFELITWLVIETP